MLNCELYGFERKKGHKVRTGIAALTGPHKIAQNPMKCSGEQSSPQTIGCRGSWNTDEKIGTTEAVKPGCKI